MGRYVLDMKYVTGCGAQPFRVMAFYRVENGKITYMRLLREIVSHDPFAQNALDCFLIAHRPFRLALARLVVHPARECEEKIGQAIQINQHVGIDGRVIVQHYARAFGTAANRPRDVQRSSGRYPTGQDERLERLQLRIHLIDGAFQCGRGRVGQAHEPVRLHIVRRSQICTQDE